MKRLLVLFAIVAVVVACQENETVSSDFTGNEATYALVQGSTYPISGTVTFREKKDGTTQISVKLTGTEGNVQHPVHLHLGNISAPDAAVAALLNPVEGSTGESETELAQLADESAITYQQLIALNACIKVHLSAAGDGKTIVLAAGNIGEASRTGTENGRLGVSVCKSE